MVKAIEEAVEKVLGKLHRYVVFRFDWFLGKRKKDITITKSNKARYTDQIKIVKDNPERFVLNWSGEGQPFLQEGEVIMLAPDQNESNLIASYYPLIAERLLTAFPRDYCLLNGEQYGSIPPSLYYCDELRDYFKPDLIILPHFLADFRLPYANAPAVLSESVSYGCLKDIHTYPYAVLLDAKVDPVTSQQIGDFFHYFEVPSKWFECFASGMLFSQTEFVLVEFISGSLTKLLRGKLTAPGSYKLIREFLSQNHNQKLYSAVLEALDIHARTLPGPSAMITSLTFSVHSSTEDSVGSALLGCGAFGFVFHVKANNQDYAMKVSIPTDQNDQLEKEYTMGRFYANRCPAVVVGAIEGSLIIRPNFQSFLMDQVGQPLPSAKGLSNEDKMKIFHSLLSLHANGCIHGDPRLANCVKVGNLFKWIDFLDVNFYYDSSVKNDLEIFLSSILMKKPLENKNEEDFNAYVQLAKTVGNNATLRLQASQLLQKLLSSSV